MSKGNHFSQNTSFSLLVVLFILLIIIGASYWY
ncbi:MAG TPA: YjcZ family sporulation protein [Sporosarcina sp.]|nr:YjcZ family sporulation protein [Sporosarcina sp.]